MYLCLQTNKHLAPSRPTLTWVFRFLWVGENCSPLPCKVLNTNPWNLWIKEAKWLMQQRRTKIAEEIKSTNQQTLRLGDYSGLPR